MLSPRAHGDPYWTPPPVWSAFSSSAAKLTGESPSEKAEQFAQSLSIILHRTNARAVLRRAPDTLPGAPSDTLCARDWLASAEAYRAGIAVVDNLQSV